MQNFIYDSNKENMTPSSYLSSNSKMLSHQKFHSENNLKALRDIKDNLSAITEINDSEYYSKLKKKEELESLVVENDNQLFKDKTDVEYLNNIVKEKETKKEGIIQNVENNPNIWLENYFVPDGIFNLEVNSNNRYVNQVCIKLNNDLGVVGTKQRENIVCNGVINRNPTNANLNEIFEKEFNQDPESLMLYAAYNLN
jgi:hypothetical protein